MPAPRQSQERALNAPSPECLDKSSVGISNVSGLGPPQAEGDPHHQDQGGTGRSSSRVCERSYTFRSPRLRFSFGAARRSFGEGGSFGVPFFKGG